MTFRLVLLSVLTIVGITLSTLALTASEFGVVDPDITPDLVWSFNQEYFNPTGDGIPETETGGGTFDFITTGPNIQVITESDTQRYGTILTHNGGSPIQEMITVEDFDAAYSGSFSFVIPLYFVTLPTANYTILGHNDDADPNSLSWKLRYDNSTAFVFLESSPDGSTALSTTVTSTVVMVTNTWYVITVTYDGSTAVTLTVNGTTVTGSATIFVDPLEPLFMFGDIPSTFVDVIFSHLWFFNSELSSANITTLEADINPINTSDYLYAISHTVSNTSASTLTNFQAPIEISTDSLITNGFMESTLDDVIIISVTGDDYDNLITMEGTSTVPVNTSEFAFVNIASLPAVSSVIVNIKSGLSTALLPEETSRSFLWNAGGNDFLTAENNAATNGELTDIGLSINAEIFDLPNAELQQASFTGIIGSWPIEDEATSTPQDISSAAINFDSCDAVVVNLEALTVFTSNIQYESAVANRSHDALEANIGGVTNCYIEDSTIPDSTLVSASFYIGWNVELLTDGDYTLLHHAETGDATDEPNWEIGLISASTGAEIEFFFEYEESDGTLHRWVTTDSCTTEGATFTTLDISNSYTHIYFNRTFSGNIIQLVVNGVTCSGSWASGNGTATPTTAGNRLYVFGVADGSHTHPAAGVMQIDELVIYNKALSNQEIVWSIFNQIPGVSYNWLLTKDSPESAQGFALGIDSSGNLVAKFGLAKYVSGAIVNLNNKNTYSALLTNSNEITLWEGSGQIASNTPAGTVIDQADIDLIRLLGERTSTSFLDASNYDIYSEDTSAGAIQSAEIRINQSTITESTTFEVDFEPGVFNQSQEGAAGNSWIWLGTITDISSEAQTTNYQIQTDQTDITITTDGLLPISSFEIAPTPDANVNFIGTIGLIPVTVTPNPLIPFTPTINAAATSLGIEVAAVWFILVYAVGLVLSTALMRTIQGTLFAILVLDIVILAGSMSGLYAYWMTGLTIVITLGTYASGVLRKGGVI